MKFLLSFLLCFGTAGLLYAQTTSPANLPEAMAQLVAPLNKTEINSHFLLDKGPCRTGGIRRPAPRFRLFAALELGDAVPASAQQFCRYRPARAPQKAAPGMCQ
jgi:hypothetical protein